MLFKNNIINLLVMGLFAVTSCEVDRLPETSISDPSFWQNEGDLRSATNYLYTFLPGLPVYEDEWSDNAYGTTPNSISDGSRLTPASDNIYSRQYVLIRSANNIFAKEDQLIESGVEPTVIAKYFSEAYFFRAWGYFELLKRYGGVQITTEILSEKDEVLYSERASREEVLNLIYADLDKAAENLPLPSDNEGEDYGRITKTAAWAFKSRVALFEGTRSKFHGYGDYQYHLNTAKEFSDKVIGSGEHGIYEDYYDLYQYVGEGPSNKENMLVKQYGKDINQLIVSHRVHRNLEDRVNPTKSLADSYLMTDGLPIDKSPSYVTPSNTLEVFANRDPRMDYSFYKTGDTYSVLTPTFTLPVLNFQTTGFANRRYGNLTDYAAGDSFIDHILIRYAEVLLIYAESTYELDEQISNEDLDKSINQLRNRPSVGLPSLTNSFVSSNELDMRNEIRRERRVELALDGFRYWDLIRWKTAEIELPKPIIGNYFFDEFGDAFIPNLTEDNYILLQSSEVRTFNPEKDYLWPLPTDQIAINPNLEQNPNW
ncbi:RagB/SusD family nutrient uptake outer membrane protein [Arenibacter algicola]|uniref:RagB/SusD family nutrient uptake outer membrane protein n=1 Tax=Arenibacter algicola TaxID=616991 RepID=UPI001C07D799|nr:RagB/SusD family nutrient uptake outer membrane protein [Arenibacter algicola]MBU2903609.1 RagB/SusD family nutrient uptake outer membrane protein [Arenibacter algicola]